MNILNKAAVYVDRGQPGGWNDLDMLEVGLGGMTDEEYKVRDSSASGFDARHLSTDH